MSLQPIFEVEGVKFFDNAPACISHFEKTHWIKKAISLIQSFGTLFLYYLQKLSLVFYRVDAQMDPLTNARSLSKKKLISCIHGLNDGPYQFRKFVAEMNKKALLDTDIFIPRVLQRGNAKLDDMVKPIFEAIATWAKTSGEKELILVVASNGARISRAIEAELAKSENNIKKIHVVSIVGANKGSSLVNLANKVGLSCLVSKNISEEMPTDSLRIRQLNKDWQEGLSRGPTREYTFIASPHDWQVPNYDSTLMAVENQKAHYAIVKGHGHISIVNAVSRLVAKAIQT